MESVVEKVNVLSFYMNIMPHVPFRVTKGGKKIITGEITNMLTCYIKTELCTKLKNGDYVIISNGIPFRHMIKDDISVFVNVNTYEKKQLVFDASEPLQVLYAGRMFGKASN